MVIKLLWAVSADGNVCQPTLANIKWLMQRHWTQGWKESHTVCSLVLIQVAPAPAERHTQQIIMTDNVIVVNEDR